MTHRTPKTPFHKSLAQLVEKVTRDHERGRKEAEAAGGRKGRKPGRPAKVHAETCPVVLHLYKDQVRWLDEYADYLEGLAPGNVHLSRVEIVRALLMALAEYATKRGVGLYGEVVITSEHDLQAAIVRAFTQAG